MGGEVSSEPYHRSPISSATQGFLAIPGESKRHLCSWRRAPYMKPSGRLPRSPCFDHTPARFTAVVYDTGISRHHLVKIVSLRVRGLKTFGTIARKKVSSFDS